MQRKYFEAERLLLLFLALFLNIWMIIANFFEFPTGIKFSGFPLTIILIGVFYLTKIKFSEKLNNNFFFLYSHFPVSGSHEGPSSPLRSRGAG